MADYTYRRVLLPNGEWTMQRVPVGPLERLPEGSPVFDRVSPQWKRGQGSSAMMEAILGRMENPMWNEDYWFNITSTALGGSDARVRATAPLAPGEFRFEMVTNSIGVSANSKIANLQDRGFEVTMSTSPGVFALDLKRARTGEHFRLLFNTLEELYSWTSDGSAKPRRIMRRYGAASLSVDTPAGIQQELMRMDVDEEEEKPEEDATVKLGRKLDLD